MIRSIIRAVCAFMLENEAQHLLRLSERVPGGIIFKASFDKANRSNAGAHRGPGIAGGLAALSRVRDETGLPILTDVHEHAQCGVVAEVVDVLQIPAFLCRQTDLLVAAGRTGRAVNVKKGQWLHPEGMRGAVDKVRGAQRRPAEVAVTERGSFFGYGDLVVDMRALSRMATATGSPVIFDGTHSVQQPGGKGESSGGERQFVPVLARAAVAAGVAAVFMETHQDPDKAPSDGPNMIHLKDMPAVLETLVEIDGVRLLASLAFEGFGAAIVPATAVPRWLTGEFRRITVPEMPRRVVGWAQRRRPAPGVATRALHEVMREVIAIQGASQPGVHVGPDALSLGRTPT
mgnify:CR=1 FL=1